ncbi:hypothetical protein FB451DRAFT_1231784 [Mycena latifolia]|nr:hypothetical protein FB451DRAFT_1231784 [Mycena latifolia]
MGHILARQPEWRGEIRPGLCTWIVVFFQVKWRDTLNTQASVERYNSVLTKIWNPDTGGYHFINDVEKAVGLSCAALSNLWEGFDFTATESLAKSVPWLRSTCLVVLRSTGGMEFNQWCWRPLPISTQFSPPLSGILCVTLPRRQDVQMQGMA